MPESPKCRQNPNEPRWVTELGRSRPDVVLMAPFMAYLLLLPIGSWLPYEYQPIGIAIRGMGSMAVFWLFRRHFPPMGKPHLGWAIGVGLLAAWGWVAGQHLCDALGIGGRLFFYPGQPEVVNPLEELGGANAAFWTQVSFRILVATTAVPIVEEIFWRAFLLRALIDWDRFETVPLGMFTWLSFLGTSLLSTLEHPDNWAVSIACWMVYNALFIWKKSILCLILTHGITNLALYGYVVNQGDWRFW